MYIKMCLAVSGPHFLQCSHKLDSLSNQNTFKCTSSLKDQAHLPNYSKHFVMLFYLCCFAVFQAPKPCPYVKEMQDAAMFYTNRVLKDYKEK